MNQHVSKIAATSFFHLRCLRQIRRRVGTEVSIRLFAPQSTLSVLQRVQNAAARLIFELGPRDHVSDSLITIQYTSLAADPLASTI